MLHSWNVGRRVCGSSSLFPQGVFRKAHFSPVWLVKVRLHFCLHRMRVNLPYATDQTSVFSFIFQGHQLQLYFLPLSLLTCLWTIGTLPIFRTMTINSLSVSVSHTHCRRLCLHFIVALIISTTTIVKVRTNAILGEDPVNNTLLLSLCSEPTEIEEWQAGGGQISAQY